MSTKNQKLLPFSSVSYSIYAAQQQLESAAMNEDVKKKKIESRERDARKRDQELKDKARGPGRPKKSDTTVSSNASSSQTSSVLPSTPIRSLLLPTSFLSLLLHQYLQLMIKALVFLVVHSYML